MPSIIGTLKRIIASRDKNKHSPQLVMWYLQAAAPSIREVDRCEVRTFRSGDEDGWLELLQVNGALGDWDQARVQKVLFATHEQFFVECEGKIVACTSVNDKERDGKSCWEIGWVAVDPAFQGRGIGKLIVGTAVARALELGARPIYLLTDDFRVPALCSYLKLGFVPDDSHPSYTRRWLDIFALLGADYQVYKPSFTTVGDT